MCDYSKDNYEDGDLFYSSLKELLPLSSNPRYPGFHKIINFTTKLSSEGKGIGTSN
jgi:hypothetical protein